MATKRKTTKKTASKATKKKAVKKPAKKTTKKAVKKSATKKAPAKKATKKATAKKVSKKVVEEEPDAEIMEEEEVVEEAPKKKKRKPKPTGPKGSFDFEPEAHEDSHLSKKQTKELFDRLIAEHRRVSQGLGEHLNDAISNIDPLSDEMDVAQRHTEQAYLMKFADKERKLLVQIGNALEKMRIAEYGCCEGTGEPIAVKRLELRPWTRYSVEYKEQVERDRKQRQRR